MLSAWQGLGLSIPLKIVGDGPLAEQVRFAATFVGLALIGSLMIFVIYLDMKRWVFKWF